MIPGRFLSPDNRVVASPDFARWLNESAPDPEDKRGAIARVLPYAVHVDYGTWEPTEWKRWIGVLTEHAPSGWMIGYRGGHLRRAILFSSSTEACFLRLAYDGEMAPVE